MSERLASPPREASDGGQELQPCDVKSSIAHGPSAMLRAGADSGLPPIIVAPAAAAAPTSSERRRGIKNFVMTARCARRGRRANQQTVRWRSRTNTRLLDSSEVIL